MTVRLVQPTPDDWPRLRALRLAALADAPAAFGSTLAREQELDEAEWRNRLDPRQGPKLWAVDDSTDVAMVGSFTDLSRPQVLNLVGMWVAPAYRGTGLAARLVVGLVSSAREGSWRTVELTVVESNAGARRLYLQHGFAETGETRPHPGDAHVREMVMELDVADRLAEDGCC